MDESFPLILRINSPIPRIITPIPGITSPIPGDHPPMPRTRALQNKQQGQGEESLYGGALGMWQSSFSQLLTHPCLCQVTRINRAGFQARIPRSQPNV